MFSIVISTHYIYRDRHDTNLKSSRFRKVNKQNEEYLGVMDINVLFFPKNFHKLKIKFSKCRCRRSCQCDAEISKWPSVLSK